MNEPTPPQSAGVSRAPQTDTPDVAEPATIRSEDLLRGANEVRIQHGNDVYRLRLTHNGRLILSK
jgi:hemin uptake protein HemP